MFRKALLLFLAVSLLGITSVIYPANTAQAVTGADWKAGRIIDDAVFTDKNSMSVQQIQAFLNQQVGVGRANGTPGVCDTNGVRPSELGGGTRAQYGASRGNPAPFTCLKDYYEVPKINPGPGVPANNYGGAPIPPGARSAAQLIWDAAQTYNISPKVLLVTIQKESAGPLITDDWPLRSQYTYAMGAYCPDSGPGGSANCDPNYAGFSIQIAESAGLMRWYLDNMHQPWWAYKKPGNNAIRYHPNAACGSSNVFIESMATAALYTYTPYQPNATALSNLYGGQNDGCSSYGNRNFWRMYNDWFGSTLAFIYNGVSYLDVFDPQYYLSQYPDLQAALGGSHMNAFYHFIYYGMNEKRQAIANFNVNSYRNRYTDLRIAYEGNIPAYYLHYIRHGKAEGRLATGNIPIQYITSHAGVNYSDVYDFQTYKASNPDIQHVYNDDDAGAIRHFAKYGMKEKRVAKASFNVTNYKNTYPDIRYVFGNNFPAYYLHYIQHGKAEGRIATSSAIRYHSALSGIDYKDVYNFTTYKNNYSDINNVFSSDDLAALKHFIQHGMHEGRLANNDFNVTIYKQRYADLRQAFGNYLPAYYLHYIQHGKAEGRIAI